MVEITIAMGVIAIGFTAILGLFPIGLQSNKDAAAYNYAGEAMQSMMNYITAYSKSNWNVATGLDDDHADLGTYKVGDAITSISGATGISSVDNQSGVYLIERKTDMDNDGVDDGPNDVTDFQGVAKIWRLADTDYSTYNKTDYKTSSALPSTYTPASTEAIILNIELTWPANIKYANRPYKLLFTKEITK